MIFATKGHFMTNEELTDLFNSHFLKIDMSTNEYNAIKNLADFYYDHNQELPNEIIEFLGRHKERFE